MAAGAEIDARDAGERPVVYCLLPAELAPKLHEPLREHFADDAGIEVVVERRGGARRGGADRRAGEGDAPEGVDERREEPGPEGRRIGERRAMIAAVQPPELPRRARRHAEQIRFVRRMEPAGHRAEDIDTARVVARIQAGDREGFGVLYSRYFDRVYSYLRGILHDSHEAEDVAQEVFVKLMRRIDKYERRVQPFRAWMFTVVRNEGLNWLRDQGRLVPTDPAVLDSRREEAGTEAEAEAEELERLEVLDWIVDRDLQLFVERLPLPQRQVLMMRFLLDMSDDQIAEATGRNPDAVRAMRSRAVITLRDRLAAVGKGPEASRADRAGAQRMKKQAFVLRERRFILGR